MRPERQTGPKDPKEGAGWLSPSALGLGWMTLAVPARLPCESSQLWPPVGALHSLEQEGGRLPVPGSQQGSQTPPGSLCRGRNPETRAWGDGPLEWGPWGGGGGSVRNPPFDSTGWGPFSQCQPTCAPGLPPLPRGTTPLDLGVISKNGGGGCCQSPGAKTKTDKEFRLPTTLGQCRNSLILVSAGKTRHCFPFVKLLCVSLGFPFGSGPWLGCLLRHSCVPGLIFIIYAVPGVPQHTLRWALQL